MSAEIFTSQDAGVQLIPLDLLDPNPWQPRTTEDAAHIEKLAKSIETHGLLQIPTARPSRMVGRPGHYELAFGHSRLAAYRWLNGFATDGRWAKFPVSIRELTDRQMAEQAAHENIERKDLSAIEVGQAIGRLMTDFNLTQAEAGAMYGYTSQSSVSNLMRLLELPTEVRQLVHSEQLPERIARALVPLARLKPDAVIQMAYDLTRLDESIATSESGSEAGPVLSNYDNIETRAANAIGEFYQKHGKQFDYKTIWDLAWPKKPMKVPGDIDIKGAPETVPACNGCPMRVKSRYNFYCMNAACFKTKGLMKAREATKATSKKLEIPVATIGEKFTVIYKGEGAHNDKTLKAILESKHESLRLVPYTTNDYQGFGRKEALGNELVALATVDEAALKKAVKGYATTEETKQAKAAERPQHDWRAEQTAREELRNRYRMIQRAAAPFFARVMPDNAAVLKAIAAAAGIRYWLDGYPWDGVLGIRFANASPSARKEIAAGVLLWAWVEDRGNSKTADQFVGYINSLQADFGVHMPSTWADMALNAPIPEEANRDWLPTQEERDADDDDDVLEDIEQDEDEDDEIAPAVQMDIDEATELEVTELGAAAVLE